MRTMPRTAIITRWNVPDALYKVMMAFVFFTSAGRLENDLDALKEELRLASRETKRQRRLALKAETQQEELWHDAFVLYVLMDCDVTAPLALMDRFGPVPHEELRVRMQNMFLQKPVAQLAAYACCEDRIVPAVKPRTEKFFKEWKLLQWVNKVNNDIGTTPGFSNISKRLVDAGVDDEDSAGSLIAKPASVNKWIQRWRRKWKASIGRVRTQLGGDREALSDKVKLKLFSPKNLKVGSVLGLIFGPVFRA